MRRALSLRLFDTDTLPWSSLTDPLHQAGQFGVEPMQRPQGLGFDAGGQAIQAGEERLQVGGLLVDAGEVVQGEVDGAGVGR
jgi:hypothetical protein